MRPRRRGLLLVRERGALRRRPGIGRDLTRRPGLEPITLERHAAIVLGSDAVITFAAAVDHRTGIRIGVKGALTTELTLAQRAGRVDAAGIEPRQNVARRYRDRRPNRLRKIVGSFVSDGERRGERGFLRAVDDGLSRQQRGEVLVSDLARQRQQHHYAEPEGGPQTTLRLVARCNHQ
jgi:hypothetical protein